MTVRLAALVTLARLGLLAVVVTACGTAGGYLSPSGSTTTLMAAWERRFTLDWSVEAEQRQSRRVRGYISGHYGESAEPVRILAQALDSSGAVVGQRIAWVPGGDEWFPTRVFRGRAAVARGDIPGIRVGLHPPAEPRLRLDLTLAPGASGANPAAVIDRRAFVGAGADRRRAVPRGPARARVRRGSERRHRGAVVGGQRPFQLRVNLKTAEALGLTIPQSILARADDIVE